MAKILDSHVLSNKVQKIVEVSEGYIINGHYYDKSTFSPRPLKIFETYGDIEDLSMNQKLSNRHTITNIMGKTYGNTIINDINDPDICYVWSQTMRSYNSLIIHKIKETTNKVEYLASNTYGAVPSNYPMISQYAGQSTDWLYFIVTCGSAYTTAFWRINKKTLAYETILNFSSYAVGTFFRETSNYVFLGYQRQYGYTYGYRYNKLTNVYEDLKLQVKGSNRYFTTRICDSIKISDTSDYTYALQHDSTTNKFYITKYVFDYSKTIAADVSTESLVTIDWGTSGLTEIKVLTAGAVYRYDPFITISSTGKRYLNIAVNESNNSSTAAHISDYGIYTFLIDETTKNLICKGFVNLSTSYFRNFLGIKNNTFLVGCTDAGILYINFDEINEKFVVTDINNVQPLHIGIDLSENIWFVNGAYEVEMISPFIPTSINLQYEKSNYKYEGTDIDTYITIEAKNYSGSNVQVMLDLTIKGSGIFTSNGLKTLRETTLLTGSKNIPIQVKGAGSLSVYPKLVL